MSDLKRRITKLEREEDAAFIRWLKTASDEELRTFAGPPDPALEAWLQTLSDAELEAVIHGGGPPYPGGEQ